MTTKQMISNESLDELWQEVSEDNAHAVTDAIQAWNTEWFNSLLEIYVETGDVRDAMNLREWTRACFREFAANQKLKSVEAIQNEI